MSINEIEKELILITEQLIAESGEPYKRKIDSDMPFQRLGIDSLGRAELFSRVEKKFAVVLPDKLLSEAQNLQDIAKFVAANQFNFKKQTTAKIITEPESVKIVDPTQAQTLVDILYLYATQVPQKTHIYFQNEDGQEEIITYQQLLKESLRVASGLIQNGLKEKETVAIMQPTHPRFFYTFFGILLAGGIPVPIYPPFRTYMLEAYAKTEARILKSAEVRMLVTFDKAENLSRLLQAFVPSLKVVTTVDELQTNAIELAQPCKPGADDFALIQYTSGSTSDPKGVLLTHRNLLANISAYGKAIKVTSKDVTVSWLPLYHDFGLIGSWFGSLYHGAPLILLTPFSFLNHPEKWLWAIHYHRGTIAGAPNFAYDLCVRKIEPSKIEGLDLSSWRVAANGAEKVYPRTLQQFADKFAAYGFDRTALLPVYGLAESTVGLTCPPLHRGFRVDRVDRKKFENDHLAVSTDEKSALEFVSCGSPLIGHEIRIVDDQYHELAERHVGNLQFRGPSSLQAYYNNPEATKRIKHADGWVDSGDLAYLADNEIFITGRQKDLIIRAGRNLYPVEIEELVGSVPGVRQGCVAAFGVTDHEKGTEQLIVVAETREKNSERRAKIVLDINNLISESLEIIPDNLILVPPHTVPKTSSGKLQRSACKDKYLRGKLGGFRLPPWLQITKLSFEWTGHKLKEMILLSGKFFYTSYIAMLFLLTFLPIYLFVRIAKSSTAEKIVRAWIKFLIFFSFCPRKIIGKENLTKASPMIYVANHASYLDGLIILSFMPQQTYFVGKKELFSVPILRTFLQKLGHLAVDRTDLSKGLEDTKQIEEILKQGNSVVIFPEGTFGYAAGLRPFRLGAFKIAAETHIPICPIALNGTRYILRDDERLLRPARITVTIAEPVHATGNEWKDVTQLRQIVRAEIAKHCGEPSLDFIAAEKVAPKLSR